MQLQLGTILNCSGVIMRYFCERSLMAEKSNCKGKVWSRRKFPMFIYPTPELFRATHVLTTTAHTTISVNDRGTRGYIKAIC